MTISESVARRARLCIDCAHHAGVAKPDKGMSQHQCRHPDLVSVVTGAAACCERSRSGRGPCGKEGALFALGNPV